MTASAAQARPSLAERAAVLTAFFVLTAGFPWEWTRTIVRGGSTSGGESIVAGIFILLAGFLALQLTGRWAAAIAVVQREPLLLILLVWTFLSAFWSEDPALSFRRAIALLITAYLGAHLVLRFTQFEVLRMISGILGAVVILNLLFIVLFPQYSGPMAGARTGPAIDFDQRLTGIYTSPNPLGRVMSLAMFTLAAAFRMDRARRPLYAFAIVCAGVVLALSQSKTALVTTALTVALLVIFLVFRSRSTLFGATALSVTAGAAASIAAVMINVSLLTSKLDRDVTLSGRVPLWEDLADVYWQRPILGHGYSAFWNGWGSPAQAMWNQHTWLPPHGHNQFIDVALTLGLIGLAIYTLLLARTFVRATRHIRDVPTVFGLWPLVFCSFFLTATLTESGIFGRDITWALLVAAIVLVSQKKRSVDVAPPNTPLTEVTAIGQTG